MIKAASNWFSPQPSEIASSRISLDFNLRAADLYFRELVAPEIGRIWFARQLSWPLAALVLHEEIASHASNVPTATAICHGIEALACKLEYFENSERSSPRILGRRAFTRDSDGEVWAFCRLRQALNYVRNTHRQAASRAIRVDGGLGFARGTRFDLLELDPVGRSLADAFLEQRVGKGGTKLRKWLRGWIAGDREIAGRSEKLLQALSPEYPTKEERILVHSRLFGTSTPASETRQRLARAIGRAADLPNIEDVVAVRLRDAGHGDQADEIIAARAFGAVLDRARDAVSSLTQAVEPTRGGVKITMLLADLGINRAFTDLRYATKNFVIKVDKVSLQEPTSRAFADAVIGADDGEVIRFIVARSGQLLGLADGSVVRGPLFRVIDATDESRDLEDGAASIEPDRTGRTFRIANLHAIQRDVDLRGLQ